MTSQTQVKWNLSLEDLKDRIAVHPEEFYYDGEDDMDLEYFGLGRIHKSHKKKSKKQRK